MSRVQRHFRLKKVLPGLLFIAPAVLLMTSTILFPLCYAIYSSLFRIRGINMRFVGADNYLRILGDPAFWDSLKISCQYAFVTVTLHIVLGLILALLLNIAIAGRSIIRIAILTPWMIAPAIGAVIWMWLLEPQFGIVNYLLTSNHIISQPVEWLGRPDTAFASIVMVDVWRGTPFVMILLLAALQGIPQSQYDAAKIDGAGPFQQFRYITLPNMSYMSIVASTLDAIDALRQFDSISVLTGGGPVNSTQVVPVLIYNTAFRANQLGDAAAVGVVFMIFIFAITTAYVVMSQRSGRQE
jgi:multiple sugar transport system permease protein